MRAFPATKPGPVIYVLPAPPSAIGGWVRPLEDHDAVVYGFSLLAASGSDTAFGVRVHHELTHLHHIQVNPQMRRVVTSFFMNRGDHRTALHELMWIEGLAVHASRQLTRGASPAIVLGSRAARANEAARAQSARAFRERMDVTDGPTVEAFVYGGTDAVPAQAVNYIGMLIAERLATRLTLPEMARLEGSELHDAIRRELEGIEAAAR